MVPKPDPSPKYTSAQYIVHHVFLPPQLPSEDDFHASHQEALLKAVLTSLGRFRNEVSEEEKPVVRRALKTIGKMLHVNKACAGSVTCSVDAQSLANMLSSWTDIHDEYLLLHVAAQNAGILVSRTNQSLRFEVFELSPRNEAATSTQGRLIRSFPASAVDVPLPELTPDFLNSLSETISKLSTQDVEDAQVQIRKANTTINECRDTTQPMMVTRFLLSYLLAFGGPTTDIQALTKHTREEVLGDNCLQPWRRSPAWLLVRVSLQLLFLRQDKDSKLYKAFMLFFMADLLKQLRTSSVQSEFLFCMSAKITQRLHKLKGERIPGEAHVVSVLQIIAKGLRSQWSSICDKDHLNLNLDPLKAPNFRNDTDAPIPKLDAFINYVGCLRDLPRFNSLPTLETLRNAPVPEQLPSGFATSTLYSSDKLSSRIAVESWVAYNLDDWLEQNIAAPDTCEQIANLIEDYVTTCMPKNSEDPESASVFFLTVLELWVACDKAAVQMSSLLADYDPGIKISNFHTLLLARRPDLVRLKKVEDYLNARNKLAVYTGPHIFIAFGTVNSFSVRYFDQSKEHQELKAHIEKIAADDREKKRAEFRALRSKYDALIRSHQSTDCDCFARSSQGKPMQFHSDRCPRARDKTTAEELEIMVHEWPLPPTELRARSAVFELKVPPFFGFWRETTLLVMTDVLGYRQTNQDKVKYRHTLKSFEGLSEHFQPFSKPAAAIKNRMYLLSEAKPHTWTHRKTDQVVKMTEEKVLLNNALRLFYFDHRASCFFKGHQLSDKVQRLTTFQLPKHLSMLQNFIDRPTSAPLGPTANEAIASQHDCPSHMTSNEFKALCTLPLGSTILWQNILIQLHQPTIDFQKEETFLFLHHTILRAGLPHQFSPLRETHLVLGQQEFALPLLQGVACCLARYEKNWQAANALSVMTLVLCRVCSLTSHAIVKKACLVGLQRYRAIALGWLRSLEADIRNSESDAMLVARRRKLGSIALTCCCSFDLDDDDLKVALEAKAGLMVLLQCSIIVKEAEEYVKEDETFSSFLMHRWTRLMSRAHRTIAVQILRSEEKSLEQAIQQLWPEYRQSESWKTASSEAPHWLVTSATSGGDRSFTVHFDIWTGTLLVDGRPLSRISKEYEQLPLYKTLFGDLVVEVVPSSFAGMRYASKTLIHGFAIHFDMMTEQNDFTGKKGLLLRARKNGKTYELLPDALLSTNVPLKFSEDYVHWFNVTDQLVEFRPKSRPWYLDDDEWALVRGTGPSSWRLTKPGSILLSRGSESMNTIARVLATIENSYQIHGILYRTGPLETQLPRLQLSFFLEQGSNLIESSQYRGSFIDSSQSLGSLIGLRDRLVLRSIEDDDERSILIPYGEVSVVGTESHISVSIARKLPARTHLYRLNTVLCRLTSDTHSLDSILWLAYMHGLTSSCLPDPLTQKTGTEQSVNILKSAAVRSFDQLSESSGRILGHITQLCPSPSCYPDFLKAMQVVKWSPDLPFLSQSSEFVPLVEKLFAQHINWTKISAPTSSLKVHNLPECDPHLLKRDMIRSAPFRVAEFGLRHFSSKFDRRYESRDVWSATPEIERVINITKFAKGAVLARDTRIPDNLTVTLRTLIKENAAKSLIDKLDRGELQYDARYLNYSRDFVAHYWPDIHEIFSDSTSNKSRHILWLAGLTFAPNAKMSVVLALASILNDRNMMESIHQLRKHLHSEQRRAQMHDQIRTIVASNTIPFAESTERPWFYRRDPDAKREYAKQRAAFHKRQAEIFDLLVARFISQVPCWNVVRPSDSDVDDWEPYMNISKIFTGLQSQLGSWFDSPFFEHHSDNISKSIQPGVDDGVQPNPLVASRDETTTIRRRFDDPQDIFLQPAPQVKSTNSLELPKVQVRMNQDDNAQLFHVIDSLASCASSQFERTYIQKLRDSLQALQQQQYRFQLAGGRDALKPFLAEYYDICHRNVSDIFSQISSPFHAESCEAGLHSARVSPDFFLEQLNWQKWKCLSSDWHDCLITYATALTYLQHAKRLLKSCESESRLVAELRNAGHTNWRPIDHPETLLLEVESNIFVRANQEQVAVRMREPLADATETSQLNMGEGKSSTIILMLAAYLSRDKKQVRVVVAKPQFKQMHSMLVAKLGGLLSRPIFTIPFSRFIKVSPESMTVIQGLVDECKASNGILLVQPEHILSLKLMAIMQSMAVNSELGKAMIRLFDQLQLHTRDVLDESDENLNVKFELVYTVGTQRFVDFSPERWLVVLQILEIMRQKIVDFHHLHSAAIELRQGPQGSFPRLRFLDDETLQLFLDASPMRSP